MPEKIEPTSVAYALDSPADAEAIVAAIERVERHYAGSVNYPTRVAHPGCGHVVSRRFHADGGGNSRAAWQRYPGER
jgi:hypothetical protein